MKPSEMSVDRFAHPTTEPVTRLVQRPGLPGVLRLIFGLMLIGGTILGVSGLANAASRSCGGDLAARAVCVARNQIGDRYEWGGDGPSAFDCSGLTYYAYRKAGLNWERKTAEGQYQFGMAKDMTVSTRHLEPGDLIFFDWDGGSVDHVGIYVGNNRMVHASSGAGAVKAVTINGYYRQHIKNKAVRPSRSGSDQPAEPDRHEPPRERNPADRPPADPPRPVQPVLIVPGFVEGPR